MLIRLSGAAAIFAGVLLVVADLLSLTHLFFPLGFESFSEPTMATSVSHYYALQAKTNLLAAVLLLGGLVGLYARQAQAAGLLGLVGF